MQILRFFRSLFLQSGSEPEAKLPRVYVSESLLEETANFIASYGTAAEPHEGIAYWAGVANDDASVVTTVFAPEATTTPGSYHTTAIANATVVARVNELHLSILTQLHGHPSSWVGHSKGDNEGAFMPYEGFYSIVVPRYGYDGLTPLTKCGVHRYENGSFRQLSGDEVQNAFHILPSSVDLRGESWPERR